MMKDESLKGNSYNVKDQITIGEGIRMYKIVQFATSTDKIVQTDTKTTK